MISETFSSIKDNIKRRATNPFLGTFTIVYILKNWVLFYGLFNFDSGTTLAGKIQYIVDYFNSINSFENFAICIGITFIILLVTYLLLAIARLIANTYEDIVIPMVYKITNKSKIVSRENYQELQLERDKIEKRYEDERKDRSRIQKERDEYYEQIVDLKASDKSIAEIENLNESVKTLQNEIKLKEDEISSLKKQSAFKDGVIAYHNEKNETKSSENENDTNNDLAEILYKKIKGNSLELLFDELAKESNTGKRIDPSQNNLEFFFEYNIFTSSGISGADGKTILKLTSLGEEIYKMRLLEKYKSQDKKKIYDKILQRFPQGRLASYILNSRNINSNSVLKELEFFTKGSDSDGVYTDENSRKDAQEFIKELNSLN